MIVHILIPDRPAFNVLETDNLPAVDDYVYLTESNGDRVMYKVRARIFRIAQQADDQAKYTGSAPPVLFVEPIPASTSGAAQEQQPGSGPSGY